MSHPTASPTTTPPAPTNANRAVAWPSENVPVTAAATAMRYATIAAASLIMLSPSSIVAERRVIGSRLRNAVAAATSGGETTAPSTNADAHGRPGTTRCATQATARVANSTCPIPSDRIGRTLARTSRYEAKSDARYKSGGMNTRNTSCGSNWTAGRPGTKATSSPPATRSAGVGTARRRATSARKATPTKSARTVSKLCMAFVPPKVSFRRGALHLPVRSRRHADRFGRADPPLLPPHDAAAPRARAARRCVDEGTGHAAVGTVPALQRRPGRNRSDGRHLSGLQPGAPRRAGPALQGRGRGGARAEPSRQDARPRHQQDAERRAAWPRGGRARGRVRRDRRRGRGDAPQAAPRAGADGARVRPRRRRDDGRRAVGTVRPVAPRGSPSGLLAGETGRPQFTGD